METEEDFLVGGRKFNLWITTFSLFATWFGAGTLLSATDEVALSGLRVTALEPYGAGFCLVIASLFLAKPLWNMQLTTYSDLFLRKFGKKVEFISVWINLPIYIGWIAVQIISLAKILALIYPLSETVFIFIIVTLATILTMIGGLWSVSLTDSSQLVIIIIGLFYLLFKVLTLDTSGDYSNHSDEFLTLIPTESRGEFFSWLSVFCVSALGNVTGQDLGQRLFSAKSANTAQRGSLLAGIMYLIIGSIPVIIGMKASSFLTTEQIAASSILTQMIQYLLDPVTAVILLITIVSAVVSTITSALLAPSSLLSHNFLKHYFTKTSPLTLCRYGVVIIAFVSLIVALGNSSVYELLENSYAIGFVALFVPVMIGVFGKLHNEKACLISMMVSSLFWLSEFFIETTIPLSLVAVLLGFATYYLSLKFIKN